MPITQDGYRIGADGSEAGHGWEAAEDTTATGLPTGTPYLTRIQLDGSGDPSSKNFALFGVRSGDPSQTEEQVTGPRLEDVDGNLVVDVDGNLMWGW